MGSRRARERRLLDQVAFEVRPHEFASELPRRAVPAGRFLAGGLLYANPGNPAPSCSNSGIAVNVAHVSTYAWAAYLAGLVLLTVWVTH